jgi:hypothetical protein
VHLSPQKLRLANPNHPSRYFLPRPSGRPHVRVRDTCRGVGISQRRCGATRRVAWSTRRTSRSDTYLKDVNETLKIYHYATSSVYHDCREGSDVGMQTTREPLQFAKNYGPRTTQLVGGAGRMLKLRSVLRIADAVQSLLFKRAEFPRLSSGQSPLQTSASNRESRRTRDLKPAAPLGAFSRSRRRSAYLQRHLFGT